MARNSSILRAPPQWAATTSLEGCCRGRQRSCVMAASCLRETMGTETDEDGISWNIFFSAPWWRFFFLWKQYDSTAVGVWGDVKSKQNNRTLLWNIHMDGFTPLWSSLLICNYTILYIHLHSCYVRYVDLMWIGVSPGFHMFPPPQIWPPVMFPPRSNPGVVDHCI